MCFDNKGTVLKTVDLPELDECCILAYAANINKRVYSHTILIGGKAFETQTMQNFFFNQ